MQLFDSLLFYHTPSAASEPRTTTFCARFNSRSYNAEIIQHQSALDDEYNSFSGNIKPIPSLLAEAPFPLCSLGWRAGRGAASAMGRNELC